MKLLLIHRYFWPDAPPYAQMLLAMGQRFAAAGHAVEVLSTQPSYRDEELRRAPPRENLDGVGVHRIDLPREKKKQTARRILNTMLFVGRVFGHLCCNRYDLVTFSTMPPVILGLAVRAALFLTGRGGRFLYHCMDLYPEAGMQAGLIQEGPVYRLLRWLDKTTCQRAAAVVVLSRDMKATLQQRGVRPGRVHVINNFSLVEQSSGEPALLPPGLPKPAGTFVVLFAGNIGRFQGLETVIDAAHLLKEEPRIRFWLLGDGLAKEDLVKKAGPLVGVSVFFHSYLPPAEAFEVTRHADLALVTLSPGLYRVAYPSKAMTCLAAGCRLLVSAERESELVETTLTEKVGIWCPQGDPAALAEAVRNEATRGGDAEQRRRAKAFAALTYSRQQVLDRWMTLLDSLTLQGGGAVEDPASRSRAAGGGTT